MSLTQLGSVTTYHRSAVANVESGRRAPDRRFAVEADCLLGAGGRLVAAWDRDASNREDLIEQRQMLNRAARESLALATETAERDDLGAQAAQLGVDYLTTPPAEMLRRTLLVRDAALAYLKRGEHPPGVHADLLLTVGRLCGVLTYAALDLGGDDQALAHARAAWRCADLAGDDELRAWTRGTQSLIVRFGGDFPRAHSLAVDGMRYVTTASGTARLLCGQAQSLAGLGDNAGTIDALLDAEDAREHIDGGDSLGGIFAFRETKQRYYSGSSLIWVTGADNQRRAEREASAAIHSWETGPEGERSLDDEALARVYVATARARLGELEGTREALAPILDLPPERRISWIGKRMTRIVDLLAEPPYDDSPTACDVREEIVSYRIG